MKPDTKRHNISIMHPALGASFPRSQNEWERKKREREERRCAPSRAMIPRAPDIDQSRAFSLKIRRVLAVDI